MEENEVENTTMNMRKIALLGIVIMLLLPGIAVAVLPEPPTPTKPAKAPQYTPDNAPIAEMSLEDWLNVLSNKMMQLAQIVPDQQQKVAPNQEITFFIGLASTKPPGIFEVDGKTYFRQLWGKWGVANHAGGWYIPMGHDKELSDIYYTEEAIFNAPTTVGGYRVWANIDSAIWKWDGAQWVYQYSERLASSNEDFYVASDLGSISITSSPSGARVELDYVYVGTTPLTITDIPANPHALSISKEGYKEWFDTIDVVAGETTTIDVALEEITTYPKVTMEFIFGGVSLLAIIYVLSKRK